MGKKILVILIVVVLTIFSSYYFIVVKSSNDELVENNEEKVVTSSNDELVENNEEKAVTSSNDELVENNEEKVVTSSKVELIENNEEIALTKSKDEIVENKEEIAVERSKDELVENKEEIVVTNSKDELVENSEEIISELADTYKEVSIGEIDIIVEFVNLTKKIDDFWVFKISLDTHSVDLDAIDFEKSISFMYGNEPVIENGFELKQYGSGHHISRVIELPKKVNGKDTISGEFDSFKMIFSNIENIEKTEIEWNMNKYSTLFND